MNSMTHDDSVYKECIADQVAARCNIGYDDHGHGSTVITAIHAVTNKISHLQVHFGQGRAAGGFLALCFHVAKNWQVSVRGWRFASRETTDNHARTNTPLFLRT